MKTLFCIISRWQRGKKGVLVCLFLIALPLAGSAWDEVPSGIAAMLQTRQINTFEDYLNWIGAHMKYQAYRADGWADPQDTMISGHGNCADLAFLHQAVLEYFGYRAKVLSIGKDHTAHVFTLFRKDRELYMFDNLKLRNFNTLSADAVVKNLITRFNASFLLQLNFESKSVKILYSKNPFPLKFKIKSLRVIYPLILNKSPKLLTKD